MASNLFQSAGTDLVYTPTDTTSATPKSSAISLSITQIDTDTGKVRFSLGVPVTVGGVTFYSPSMKKNVQVLLDKVSLCLLTTLGESKVNPTMGSSLTQTKTTNQDMLTLQAQILSAITSVQNMIINSQRDQALSPAQTLQQLKLSNMYQDPNDPTTVLVDVIVVNGSNAQYILTA